MERLAVEGFGEANLRLETPFVHLEKYQIITMGAALGVPYSDTWSCYNGNEKHCGRCGTCVERKHAFRDAMVADPTQYEDPEYGLTCNLSIAPA
jgi:7-cyano-7-deazaguanine synthase